MNAECNTSIGEAFTIAGWLLLANICLLLAFLAWERWHGW
jgi:hypothetical protein